MPNYDYDKDLLIARECEKEVADILTKYGIEILGFEHTNKYDILTRVDGKEYTFEVKEDFTCERTGNVGLEFECRGRPSGIQVSKADYYIYKIHTKNDGICFFLCKTSNLKNMIDAVEYFRVVNGGDRMSNSMNYLFEYTTFAKHAKLIAHYK